MTQDHYYEFDKEWEMEYGKGMGVMHVVCTREKPHILMCRYIVSLLNASMESCKKMLLRNASFMLFSFKIRGARQRMEN